MGFFYTKPKEIDTLNPEQNALQKTLGSRLSTLTAQGPQQYGGQLSAPISAGEEGAIAGFNRLAPLTNDTLSRLINLDDAAFEDRFTQEMVQPAFRNFRSEVAPLIEESLPSFSTARGRAIEQSASGLNDQLLGQRFAARESARERALRAIGQSESYGRTSAEINAIPRGIQQAGLDRAYLDYVQGNQQYSQDIGSALNFLGIQTKAIIPQSSGFEKTLATAQTIANIIAAFNPKGGNPGTPTGQSSSSGGVFSVPGKTSTVA